MAEGEIRLEISCYLKDGREDKDEGQRIFSISREEIEKILAEAGIFYGLKDDTIDKIAAGEVVQDRVLIAEGMAPEKGSPARLEKRFPRTERSGGEDKNSDKVEHYKNIVASILPLKSQAN